MTDPEFADATYVEPLDLETLTRIIERERPDALLPTLGGQTALNLAIELHDAGVLEQFNVELIGASVEAIHTAEDRHEFKAAMKEIGLVGAALGPRVHARGRADGRRGGRLPADRAAVVHPRRRRHRLRVERRRDAPRRRPRPRDEPGVGDPRRAVGGGLEGVRARGDARPRRQRRRRLLDRELRLRWACTPATRSPSRPRRRSPTSSTSACATPRSRASAASVSTPAGRTSSSR